MAEKDANYYYNRALQARQHGNERLAQYMENYARQLDRDLGRGADGRDGYGVTEVPYTAPPAPAKNERLYQQYKKTQAPAIEQPVIQEELPPTVVNSGIRDDSDVREGGYIYPDQVGVASIGHSDIGGAGAGGGFGAPQGPYPNSKPFGWRYRDNDYVVGYYNPAEEGRDWSLSFNTNPNTGMAPQVPSASYYDKYQDQPSQKKSWKQRLYPGLHKG